MSHWTQEQLQRVQSADDLHVAPFRADGITPGTPTWIWSVVVDEALYARAYHGPSSRWFQAAVAQKSGEISIAGLTTPATFEPIGGEIQERIDAAYREKYHASSYLAPMLGEGPRAATVRISPA